MRRSIHPTALTVWLAFLLALILALTVALLASGGGSGEPDTAGPGPTAEPTAHVTVNAAKPEGALNNPAWYQNQADHSQQLTGWQVEQLRKLSPRVTRAWVTPQRFFDAETGRFDFDYPAPNGSSAYQYLDQVVSYTDRLFLNFNQCDRSLMDPDEPQRCAEVLYRGIKHYKQRYPALEFVEIFNEPDRDWEEPPAAPQPMDAATYYRWYQHAYQAVNRVNDEMRPRVPLKVGGPVTYHFNSAYIQAFLDEYRDDTDPGKRLDFISYHQYRARSDPAAVGSEKQAIRRWLEERDLAPETPVYVTEYGVFPGDNAGTTYEEDLLTHAAAMSVLGVFYAQSGMDMPMHWVVDHPTNTRKSMFVDERDGVVYPYFNVVRMQMMLRSELVEARSSELTEKGVGVVPLATADDSGVSVLITNYQWTDPGPDHVVSIDIDGLKAQDMAVRVYLIDRRHNNMSGGDLVATRSYVTSVDGLARVVVELQRNATALVTMEPA